MDVPGGEALNVSHLDLPERQPVILCSSQRDQHGCRQKVSILSKSCSYACFGAPGLVHPYSLVLP